MIRNYFRTAVKLDFRRFRNWTGMTLEMGLAGTAGRGFGAHFVGRCDASAGSTNLPLKKSANGRYLVDQNNTVPDSSGHCLVADSEYFRSRRGVYFAKRQIAGSTSS